MSLVLTAVAEALIGSVVEKAVFLAREAFGISHKARLESDPEAAKSALRDHLTFIESWASEISFRDLLRSKKLIASFVDLECNVGVLQSPEGAKDKPVPVTTLLDLNKHAVILGGPGAGKTTSLQRIALNALQRLEAPGQRTPILLRLRELSDSETVLQRLAAVTAIRVVDISRTKDPSEKNPSETRELQRRTLSSYLNEVGALVLLDGLDECPLHGRKIAEKDIDDLMLHAQRYSVIVTCRNADYTYSFPAQSYTILPLSEKQVQKFAAKWLGKHQANAFTSELAKSPYRGAEVLPLTLAHLCAIYERRGKIPREPRFIYQKLVRLLIEEWDEQRGIQRQSRYSRFDVDRKLEFLRRIAFELTVAGSRGSFSHAKLEKAYLRAHGQFALPASQCSQVAREIESHTGLILQSSYDRYEFAHRSIQEFLTAEYLLRRPLLTDERFLLLGEEFAIAAALSTAAELYIEDIARALLRQHSDVSWEQFARVFIGRLFIEKPDVESSDRLGWALLTIWELGSYGTGPRDSNVQLRDTRESTFSELTSDECLGASVAAVIRTSRLSPATPSLWRAIPPDHLHLPPEIVEFLTYNSILVPRQALGLAL